MTFEPDNEWGIPDWKHSEAYGKIEEWSSGRWIWEFYRRRDDIREYFDKWAEQQYLWSVEYFKIRPEAFPRGRVMRPEEPGFSLIVDYESRRNLGCMNIPNPRISEHPYGAFSFCGGARRSRILDPGFRGDTIRDLLDMAAVELTEKQRFLLGSFLDHSHMPLGDTEVVVVIDADLPLRPQLEMAEEGLKYSYEKLGKKLQRRVQRDKWFGYLRTLDARASGATWSEIAKIHPNTAQTEQTARDIWQAAASLRFNF